MSMHEALRMKLGPDEHVRFRDMFPNAKLASVSNALHRANQAAKAEGAVGEFYYACGLHTGNPVIGRHPEDIAAECHTSSAAARRHAHRARTRHGTDARLQVNMAAEVTKGPPVPMTDLPSGRKIPTHELALSVD